MGKKHSKMGDNPVRCEEKTSISIRPEGVFINALNTQNVITINTFVQADEITVELYRDGEWLKQVRLADLISCYLKGRPLPYY